MPRDEEIASGKMKFKGYFSTGSFYDLLFDLFISMEYSLDEQLYKQNDMNGLLKLTWVGTKIVDKYTMFIVTANVLLVGWKRNQSIAREGKTLKIDFGDLEVKFKAVLRRDYEGKWEQSPILNSFLEIYDKFIYTNIYDEWKKRIKEEMHAIANDLKSFFDLQYPVMGN